MAKADLGSVGTTTMRVHGQSMEPIIKSGSLLTLRKCKTYEIGDTVFCQIRGRYIDAHLITKIKQNDTFECQYMIANNRGIENGWTKTVYGKVTKVNGKPL